MKISKRTIRSGAIRAAIVIFLFVLVFQPPIFSISISYIAMFLMMAYVAVSLLKARGSFNSRLMSLKQAYGFIPFMVYVLALTCVYVFATTNGELRPLYISNFTHMAILFVYATVSYCFLVVLESRLGDSVRLDWFQLLIAAATVQALLMVIAHELPEFRDTLNGLYLQNTRNATNKMILLDSRWRAVGLSGYYFDNLAFVLSGVSVIAIAKAMFEKKLLYYVLGMVIAFASVLTARTGIVLIVIGLAALLLYYMLCVGLRNVIIWSLIGAVTIFMAYILFSALSPEFQRFVKTAVNALVLAATSNEKSSALSEILDADLVFPENILFGVGAKPESLLFFDRFGRYIDNGYIQVLWRFGVVGLVLLLVGLVWFVWSLYTHAQSSSGKAVAIALPVVLLVFMVKFYVPAITGASIVYFVMPSMCCRGSFTRRAR